MQGMTLAGIREHVFSLEDTSMKSTGAAAINKILFFAREPPPNRKIHLVPVGEKLAF